MKAFLDTSVLVAAFYGDHEYHVPSLDLFLRFGKRNACCAAHSLAEVYATLTGMPPRNRVSGDTALLFLHDVREHLTLVVLDDHEYFQTIEQAARANLASGAVYDALLAQCAVKARAETIYTLNIQDLLRLIHRIGARVKRPGE